MDGQSVLCVCPTTAHAQPPLAGPLYVVGCGATFCAVPDNEGQVDCPECGMWFTPLDPASTSR